LIFFDFISYEGYQSNQKAILIGHLPLSDRSRKTFVVHYAIVPSNMGATPDLSWYEACLYDSGCLVLLKRFSLRAPD